MALNHQELRKKFASFWEKRQHRLVPPIPLIPPNDPTTLFTSSGMQQLVPYLLGEPHPLGKRLYNIQLCFRLQDIEEVGDNRHITSFEMLGNWSLGDYFKKEQLNWLMEFLLDKVGLPLQKLYVTVFSGEKSIPADTESIFLWQEIFRNYGMKAEVGDRIFTYDATKNWWSRAGSPEKMPVGEPGGPDSEVFFDFGADRKIHEQSPWKNQPCHVNCDCGRYLEIGNSVFMEYKKTSTDCFVYLPKKNVDFGGGLERILAASQNNPDIFQTDIFYPIIQVIEKQVGQNYATAEKRRPEIRIIADHLRGAALLIAQGVIPANKEQGYILRRLLRRTAVKIRQLTGDLNIKHLISIGEVVLQIYDGLYDISYSRHKPQLEEMIKEEIGRFQTSLERGLKEIAKKTTFSGKTAFDLYQSHGFPLELTQELLREKGIEINRKEFETEFNKHRELSRTASQGKFKGGLADESKKTIRYHTATHLLHQALCDILGAQTRQEGSNITNQRLRFDFFSPHSPTDEQLKIVESIVNQKIAEKLPVNYKIMPKAEAEKLGAKSFFRERYPELVKVYFIGNYSKEFCGGPHVKNTGDIGSFKIYRLEKIGRNIYRIYAR